MRERYTRRRALATLPALAAGVAGCSALQEADDGGGGSDGASGGGTTPDTTDATAGTATPTGSGGGGLESVDPWVAHDGDPAGTGRIEGTVPTSGLTERWSETRDFVNAPVTEPVFNEGTVLVAFERRAELLFCDHAGNVLAEPSYYGSFGKFAQSDGFLIESRFEGVRKYDNTGSQVFEKNPGYGADFEPHPAPDTLSYTRTTEADDGRTVGRVGVYDFDADQQVWETVYDLQPGEDRVSYRLSDCYIDPEREVLVVSILRDENVESTEYRGALLGLDLETGTERWHVEGVNRRPCNCSGGRLCSAAVRWAGSASRPPNQYVRSYHVTDLASGRDRRVVGRSDGDLGRTLFDTSKISFDAGIGYLVGDRLYVSGPERRRLFALDLDGTRSWTYEPRGPIECEPRAADNALVLGTGEGLEFVGYDGSRLGTFALDTSFEGGIMLTPGRVYAAGNAIHAVEAA